MMRADRTRPAPAGLLLTLLVLLVGGLLGACGQSSTAGEKVPALAAGLDRVDAAVESGNPAEARSAVKALIARTDQAESAGRLSSAEADRILRAARSVLAQLPAPAPQPPEPAPASPSDRSEHAGPAPQERDHPADKSKEKHGRNKDDDSHGWHQSDGDHD